MDTLYNVLYVIIFPFFNLFHPVRVIGRENIPQGAAVVCPNHTSLADPLMTVFAFGRKFHLRAMAKQELFHIPFIGWLLKKVGMFGVDRGKADITAVKTALKVLKGGDKLMMFPEGTRVGEGESVEAKTGAAMFALRTGAPLLPVYIPGNKKLFRRTPVVIGEPYYPQGGRGTQEIYREVADELMVRIQGLAVQAK